MICNNCKREVKGDAKFCPYCGKALETETNGQKKTTIDTSNSNQFKNAASKNSGAKKSNRVLRTVGIICASVFAIFIVFAGISAITTGVQKAENAKLSEINVIAAQRAVNAADGYLNGETTFATQAVQQLENAIDLMEPAETEESEQITSDVKNSMKIILNEIQSEQWLNGGARGDGDMKKVKENRDLIAKYAELE